MTLKLDPDQRPKDLAIGLDQELRIATRDVDDLKSGLGLMSMDQAVTLMKTREMRKDLFKQAATRLGALGRTHGGRGGLARCQPRGAGAQAIGRGLGEVTDISRRGFLSRIAAIALAPAIPLRPLPEFPPVFAGSIGVYNGVIIRELASGLSDSGYDRGFFASVIATSKYIEPSTLLSLKGTDWSVNWDDWED